MAASKFKLYLTPQEYSTLAMALRFTGNIDSSILARAGYEELNTQRYEMETIRRKIDVHLGKIESGHIKPEYTPVAVNDRVRSNSVNAHSLGFEESSNGGSNGSNNGKHEVVGFETFDDALAASGFADEDALMASIMGVSVEEYKASLLNDATISK